MPGVAAPGSAGRETIRAPANATTSPALVSGSGMSPDANATTTGTAPPHAVSGATSDIGPSASAR